MSVDSGYMSVLKKYQVSSTGVFGFLIACTLGVLFVFRYFPPGFLDGSSSYWLTESDDVTQYIAGFNAYFHSPWKFPLLSFDSLNYPEGTRATFVDIIPIYAFLLKLFLPMSTPTFNPFGYWVGLVFLLQSCCGWWVLRELNIKSWAALISFIVVLLYMPALLSRLGHISLMSHWIILAALALYIRGYKEERLSVIGWTVLFFIAFYVNVYLFVMALAVYSCSVLVSYKQISVVSIVRSIIPLCPIVLSVFIFIFPIPMGQVSTEWGFGYYSMNLLAPITGSAFFSIPDASMPGQFEGFNYLGLGVIAAFIASFVYLRRDGWGVVVRHRFLSLLMLLFTVYALSNLVYIGVHQLFVINYPPFMTTLTSQFRASGRFFWPVGYAIVIFSFLMLYRKLSPARFYLVMMLLVLVQFADVAMARHNFVAGMSRPYSPILSTKLWEGEIGRDVKYLYFYPKFRCGKMDSLTTLMPVMKYAAMHNLKLNTGYIARHQPPCDEESLINEISNSEKGKSAFIFVKSEFVDLKHVYRLLPNALKTQCAEIDFAFVCH